MLSRTARSMSWTFFRACVALKQVLAAKKKRPVRRASAGAKLRTVGFLATGIAAATSALCAEPAIIAVSDQAITLPHEKIQPIRGLSTSIAPPAGELPPDSALLRFGDAPVIEASNIGGRDWLNYAYFWQASALCHRPVYLEERAVERVGLRARFGLQPAVSAAHFFAGVPTLPVQMAIKPPWQCDYTLGIVRPGDAPCSP
jgi:hypothetical protein